MSTRVDKFYKRNNDRKVPISSTLLNLLHCSPEYDYSSLIPTGIQADVMNSTVIFLVDSLCQSLLWSSMTCL